MGGASRLATRSAAVRLYETLQESLPWATLGLGCPSPKACHSGPRECLWRFSMSDPFRRRPALAIPVSWRCRPLARVIDVRFRPSSTAPFRGLRSLSFAGCPRMGITLAPRRASAHRRAVCSSLGRAPARSRFRASAGFSSPRLPLAIGCSEPLQITSAEFHSYENAWPVHFERTDITERRFL